MYLQAPRVFENAKAGNRQDENEDSYRAVYPFRIGAGGKEAARLVLSDGASESAFARIWSNILTRNFIDRPPTFADGAAEGLEDWLAGCREEWNQEIPWQRIPWHGAAKTRAGSAATLLGLYFSQTTDRGRRLRWQAVAVGDSCLFLVRQDKLEVSFPLKDYTKFNNTPALLCSNPANSADLQKTAKFASGECEPGDLFILASDSLAAWFLARNAREQNPWENLRFPNPAGWSGWLDELRKTEKIKNDDTTLALVQVDA